MSYQDHYKQHHHHHYPPPHYYFRNQRQRQLLSQTASTAIDIIYEDTTGLAPRLDGLALRWVLISLVAVGLFAFEPARLSTVYARVKPAPEFMAQTAGSGSIASPPPVIDNRAQAAPVFVKNYRDKSPSPASTTINLVAGTADGLLKSSVSVVLLSADSTPQLSASPDRGPAGTLINLKGSDFPPNINLNIAIGRANSEFGGSLATPVTRTDGTFEVLVRLPLDFPLGQLHPSQAVPPPSAGGAGELILVAHTLDFTLKALAPFTVTSGLSTTQTAGSDQSPPVIPGAVPSSGWGYQQASTSTGRNNTATTTNSLTLSEPTRLALFGLVSLATVCMIIYYHVIKSLLSSKKILRDGARSKKEERSKLEKVTRHTRPPRRY